MCSPNEERALFVPVFLFEAKVTKEDQKERKKMCLCCDNAKKKKKKSVAAAEEEKFQNVTKGRIFFFLLCAVQLLGNGSRFDVFIEFFDF